MIDEMDLLDMDERQRGAWLMANRATVLFVGLTWIAMIVWELAHSTLERPLHTADGDPGRSAAELRRASP